MKLHEPNLNFRYFERIRGVEAVIHGNSTNPTVIILLNLLKISLTKKISRFVL